jgi:hypothetical protein
MLPPEVMREIHSSDEAREYDVLELGLDAARNDVPFSFKGNCVSLIYLSVSGSPIRVKLGKRDAKSIPFYSLGSITRAFDKVFVSHDAIPGGKAVLLLDWDLRT